MNIEDIKIEKYHYVREGGSEDILIEKKKILQELFDSERFKYLEDSLNSIYKDQWDFIISKNFILNQYSSGRLLIKDLQLHIIIKFSKIQITNSRGDNHEIIDLYVRFKLECYDLLISISFVINSYIEGVRSTLYDYEALSGYIHSHLIAFQVQYVDEYNFNYFCTGYGPINIALGKLQSRNYYKNLILRGFLYQLRDFVAWESLEGIPYSQMKNRFNIQGESIQVGFNNSLFADLDINNNNNKNRRIVFNKLLSDSNFSVLTENDSIKVVISEKEEKLLAKKLYESGFKFDDNLFCLKSGEKFYSIKYNIQDEIDTLKAIDKELFEFKGEKIHLKIKFSESKNFTPEKYLNPYWKKKILNYIKLKIEKSIINERRTEESRGETKVGSNKIRYSDTFIYI